MPETTCGREAFLKVITSMPKLRIVFYNHPRKFEGHVVEALTLVEPHLKIVPTFQENVCTGAADGYARMTGQPAIAVVNQTTGLQASLANQHNAKRAGVPMLIIVAEEATGDAFMRTMPEESGLPTSEALAGTVSRFVVRPSTPQSLAADLCRAVASLDVPAEPSQSRIATCVIPENLEWNMKARKKGLPPTAEPPFPTPHIFSAAAHASKLDAMTSALKEHGKGVALLLGGAALYEPCLGIFGAIAQATGCRLLGINLFSRIDRGVGHPTVDRLPYFPDDTLKLLSTFKHIILCNSLTPVAQFGYEDMISSTYPSAVPKHELNFSNMVDAAAHLLSLVPKAGSATPLLKPKPPPSSVPHGKLTPAKMCSLIAMLQPENAIIVDESLTSGSTYYEASSGCPSFSHLYLTGGAIGQGMPCAVGCAIACPDRKIINIQADGSGLYTSQALYTQAIEKLNVLTVICANETYQILRVEQRKQGVKVDVDKKAATHRNLTSLRNPTLDWEAIAGSYGVTSTTATTVAEFETQFRAGIANMGGPRLIVAKL